MQSIEPATGLRAVAGATDPFSASMPAAGDPAATPPAVPGTLGMPATTAAGNPQNPQQRTPDTKAFGRDSFAIFTVDKETGATRIAIYDGDGYLLRMIPPDGVSQMAREIAAYRGLG